MFPYQSGHSIGIVDAWGFQGVHLSGNRYYNRVTEGSDWNGANSEDFGLLMFIGPELSSARKVWSVGNNYRVYVWKRKGEDYRPDLYAYGEKKQFSQITFQSYGMGLHYLVRYRKAFFCGRQYRCREILGYTRGEFVASYCATLSYGGGAKYFRCIRLTSSRLGKERTVLTPSRGPHYSPDLNPIENWWTVIKKKTIAACFEDWIRNRSEDSHSCVMAEPVNIIY